MGNLIVGEEYADSKILMEAIKLSAATTQRDADNYLMDNIRRQMEAAAFKAIKHKNDHELA